MNRLVLLITVVFLEHSSLVTADDARKPAAVAVEGVPEIPSALVDRLRQYQSVRSAGFRGWSPDGHGMLVATQFGATAQLHRVYEPGGRREQVTFGEEPVDGQFLPGHTDGSLLLETSRGGDENFQLLMRRGKYGRPELWTDGKSRHLLGPVNDAGTHAIVASNRRNGRDMDVFLVPLAEKGEWKELMRVDGQTWQAHDWSPDGKRVLMSRYVSINESHQAVLDVETGNLTPLPLRPRNPLGREQPVVSVSFTRLRFGKNPDTIYLTSDARGEFQQLFRFNLSSGEYDQSVTWQNWKWDVEEIEVDHKTGHVAVVLNEDGSSALWLLDGNDEQSIPLPTGVVDRVKFSPDGKNLGFTLARPNAPADAFSWDIAGKKLTQWTFGEVGGLDPLSFITSKLVRFPSFDKRSIPAFYFAPKNASPDKKAPVLIQIHGGPESQSRPTFSGIEQFYLNELGIAVLVPNVRGSAGYGKTYLTLDNGPQREDSVKDIGALLDWIAQQPELDASRVAVIGGSYGGFMVLSTLTHYSERIRAGVDVVGIANFITFLETTSAYRRDLRRAEYGDERDPAMRAVFERINPTSNAQKIRSALLVAHGRNDPRVPFSEAELIAPLVRKNNVPVWTVYADNEGHGFRRRENRDYLTAATVLFLQKHLIGD
jgi:dipeptidyl aminopeptidase/acylaminoacyl peptidase